MIYLVMFSPMMLWISFLILTVPPVASQACVSSWHGQYKCHSVNGDFSGTCVPGWFGPGCQYADMMNTHAAGSTRQELRDGDHNTCIVDQNLQSVTLSLTQEFPLTWMRFWINATDLNLLVGFKVQLQGSNGQTVTCNNMRKIPYSTQILDVYCDGDVAVQSVTVTGEGVKSLCTVSFSGGRNIALNQPAIQSSLFIDTEVYIPYGAYKAVDGDLTRHFSSTSCTAAERNDPAPYWRVDFTQPRMVYRYVLYNRRDCCMDRMQGFTLTSYSVDNQKVFQYKDKNTQPQEVYTFNSVGITTPVSYVVLETRSDGPGGLPPQLVFCELEVYGDSACEDGMYGRECGDTCSSSCFIEGSRCEVSTGVCSQCQLGKTGKDCALACDKGWFGPSCQYKCHDSNGDCTGDCHPGWSGDDCQYKCHHKSIEYCTGDCVPGWFGPDCQYADLMSTHAAELTPQELRDGDDGTCITDQKLQSVTLNLTQAFPFTWTRLVMNINDLNLLLGLNVQLHGSSGQTVTCNNMRKIPYNREILDVYCDGDVAVQNVTVTGEGVKHLCSVFFSGGRNVAVKQQATQSSDHSVNNIPYVAAKAVDGDPRGRFSSNTCSQTNVDDTAPYWRVDFTQSRMVTRYVLYNRIDCCMDRLQGFTLTSYTADNIPVFQYQDQVTEPQKVYTVISVGITTPVSYVVIQTRSNGTDDAPPVLTLCELEVYGDSVCKDGMYGRECNDTCGSSCGTTENTCDVSTGKCSECQPGVTGYDCGLGCPNIYHGSHCQERCSTNCVDQICNGQTGYCVNCPAGKQGNMCDQECPPTKHGSGCLQSCSNNCVDQLCDSATGSCKNCPTGRIGDQCDRDLCPPGFCKNGGRCAGFYTCDCSTTDFYGDTCQYTKNQIPVEHFKFLSTDTNNYDIITTNGNLPYSGQVEVIKDKDTSVIMIPAGSYVNIDWLLAQCLQDIDDCKSGFSITNTHSFSPVDKEGIHIVLSTEAGLVDGVKGISFYYKSGYLYCYVVTSTQVWSIVIPFELTESKWYEMTVSWHPGQGLVLLLGNNVIGSNTTSSPLATEATVSRPLLIGSGDGTSSTTVLIVKEIITVPVFWKEVQRSTVLFTKETSSGSLALETAQIVGIAVGCFVALVFAVVAVAWIISYSRKRSTNEPSDPVDGISNDGYITPSDHSYGMSSTSPYTEPSPDSNSGTNNTSLSEYDYIRDDYITVIQP